MSGGWRYQAARVTCEDGSEWYDVREVFLGLNDDGTDAYTESGISPGSDTKSGLVTTLQMMLADVTRFPAIEVEP